MEKPECAHHCDTCLHFQADTGEGGAKGDCHRYPKPEYVRAVGWCGEWKSKSPVTQKKGKT